MSNAKNTKDKLLDLVSKMETTAKKCLSIDSMLAVSFSSIFVRCGKSNCWCADKTQKGHPVNRITWLENGSSKSKVIPEDKIDLVKKEIQNNRDFRKARKELRLLGNQINSLLYKIEKASIKKTKKAQNFL